MAATTVCASIYNIYSNFVVYEELRDQHMQICKIAQENLSSNISFGNTMHLIARVLFVVLDHIPVVSIVTNVVAVFFGHDACKIIEMNRAKKILHKMVNLKSILQFLKPQLEQELLVSPLSGIESGIQMIQENIDTCLVKAQNKFDLEEQLIQKVRDELDALESGLSLEFRAKESEITSDVEASKALLLQQAAQRGIAESEDIIDVCKHLKKMALLEWMLPNILELFESVQLCDLQELIPDLDSVAVQRGLDQIPLIKSVLESLLKMCKESTSIAWVLKERSIRWPSFRVDHLRHHFLGDVKVVSLGNKRAFRPETIEALTGADTMLLSIQGESIGKITGMIFTKRLIDSAPGILASYKPVFTEGWKATAFSTNEYDQTRLIGLLDRLEQSGLGFEVKEGVSELVEELKGVMSDRVRAYLPTGQTLSSMAPVFVMGILGQIQAARA